MQRASRCGPVVGLVCFLVCLVTGAVGAVPSSAVDAGKETSGGLFLEYFDSANSKRDIRVVNLGVSTISSLPWSFYFRGGAHATLASGTTVMDGAQPAQDSEVETLGAGLTGGFRWVPVKTAVVRPFIEAAFGVLYMSEEFPPGGTLWNFDQRYMAGILIDLGSDVVLEITVGRLHVSNGRRRGHPRNPSYDGNGFMIEISR
jgi:hypothetical protein